MSVMFFGAETLAKVAFVACSGPFSNAEQVEAICNALATISEANARCYAYRYREKGAIALAVTPVQLKFELSRADRPLTRALFLDALSTANLLAYNCDEDRDFLAEVAGGHAALSTVLGAMLQRAADRIEGSA